jgi:BarA-like signal transduction histidine kinase
MSDGTELVKRGRGTLLLHHLALADGVLLKLPSLAKAKAEQEKRRGQAESGLCVFLQA